MAVNIFIVIILTKVQSDPNKYIKLSCTIFPRAFPSLHDDIKLGAIQMILDTLLADFRQSPPTVIFGDIVPYLAMTFLLHKETLWMILMFSNIK